MKLRICLVWSMNPFESTYIGPSHICRIHAYIREVMAGLLGHMHKRSWTLSVRVMMKALENGHQKSAKPIPCILYALHSAMEFSVPFLRSRKSRDDLNILVVAWKLANKAPRAFYEDGLVILMDRRNGLG